MPSAADSSRIWVESLLSLTAGASSELVLWPWGVGSLVAYVRNDGAMALVAEGRRAGARTRDAIDLGRADMVVVSSGWRAGIVNVGHVDGMKLGWLLGEGAGIIRRAAFFLEPHHRPHALHLHSIVLPALVRRPKQPTTRRACN
jgi:hypothetical protein